MPSYPEESPISITTLPTYEPYLKQMAILSSLEGMLPSEIGNLRTLEYLELQENNVDGTLPTELFGLVSLEEFNLSENSLNGSLPPYQKHSFYYSIILSCYSSVRSTTPFSWFLLMFSFMFTCRHVLLLRPSTLPHKLHM